MPFCASCGAQVEGRFCAKCGATVDAPAGPAAPPPVGGTYPPLASPPAVAGMADNAASALCYVLGLITGILFLVLEPYNKNRTIRFHAFQSIFMHIAVIFLYIVLRILFTMVFGLVGLGLGLGVLMIFNLACLALWIFMIVTTYQGRTTVLPIIGPLAQQQAQRF
jgi:uncharacterized membrane protein